MDWYNFGMRKVNMRKVDIIIISVSITIMIIYLFLILKTIL